MGRPRKFDEGDAIASAAAVFRRRGYEATSVDHLVEATGVHRGSLYATFGSKHGLFLRVLDAAADVGGVELVDLLLVALLELAPIDDRVKARTRTLLREHGITAETLGNRLILRGDERPVGPENLPVQTNSSVIEPKGAKA